MRIKSIRIAETDLLLKKPFQTARGPIESRRCLILAIEEQNGAIGLGEISPLPGFGTEDWDAAFEVIGKLQGRKDYPACGHTIEEFATWRERVGLFSITHPASCFGVECALLSIAAQLEEVNPPELLSSNPLDHIQVNALIGGGEPDEVLLEVKEAVKAGYTTVKLKVGEHSLREDLELLQVINERNPAVRVRLDANEAWPVAGTIAFLDVAAGFRLEYVEDPVPPEQMMELFTLSTPETFKIGLDEAARDVDEMAALLKAVKRSSNVVVILKPMRLGSFTALRDQAAAARSRSAAVVITGMFESSLGLSYEALCAGAFGSAKFAHGLGTASYLTGDMLDKPLNPVKGIITIPDIRWLMWHVRPELAAQLDLENNA
jgi:o-succinylbenzoate synthase